MENCQLFYAGKLNRTLWMRSAKSVTVTNNLIEYYKGVGINWEWSTSKITDNRINRGIGIPMQGMAIGVAQFSGNTAVNNTLGDYARLLHHDNSWMSGDLTLTHAQTPNNSGVFVVAFRNNLRSPKKGTLTISAGMVLKMEAEAGLGSASLVAGDSDHQPGSGERLKARIAGGGHTIEAHTGMGSVRVETPEPAVRVDC